ncbi:MAG: hypothetical protein ACRC33_18600, partial [Gemmataceae bacterium]
DADACLRGGPPPRVVYTAACAHALLSPRRPASRAEAVRLLDRALRGGFGADLLETDADLAALRADEAFRRLVSEARERKAG